MSLKAQIDEAIKTAMRAKDADALRALRAIKSAIMLAETAEGRPSGELSETEEMQLLTKQAKQRRDSIAQFEANGREDLASIERAELRVIESFLPKALSPDALEAELRAIIAELGASGPSALGQVMKTATGRLAGRADGKTISDLVRKLLA